MRNKIVVELASFRSPRRVRCLGSGRVMAFMKRNIVYKTKLTVSACFSRTLSPSHRLFVS